MIFAKAPVTGRVKTRFLPQLSAEAAAELQEALLLDTAGVALEAAAGARPAARLWCAAAEAEDESPLRRLLPGDFEILPQGRGDLGERLARVFAELLASHRSALALGADCAELTVRVVREALQSLARAGAVLGAARDGGYWAIGLAEPQAELFRAQRWSSSRVADETRARMAALGLPVVELPVLGDLDRFQDLVEWLRRPNARFARTLAWCKAQGLTQASQ